MSDSVRLQEVFRGSIRRAVKAALGEELDQVPVSWPPSVTDGDVATTVSFELGRRLRTPPRRIAEAIAAAYEPGHGIERVQAAGAGYLNGFFERTSVLRAELLVDRSTPPRAQGGKIIVEHTNINPNKAAHIGHLRNAVLGDTLVRCLRRLGRRVEVQNYIDDTGVQVADVVVGFRELEGQTLDGVKHIAGSTRFDFYCWDLYARVTEWYEADKARLKHRADTLHAIEAGGSDVAVMGAFVADRIVHRHLETMARLNIGYDLLSWEGDILR
ncbi:MAG: arginine--tRNA ligase, partial [Longimicrobiales bacterium]